MAFGLLKRLVLGRPLTHAEHDQNLDNIETEVASIRNDMGGISASIPGHINGVFDSNVSHLDHKVDDDVLVIHYTSGHKLDVPIKV